MSKLLDLLAQQKALVEQIKALEADEKEAKVIKFVEELEALRERHGYSVPDFIDVVHSLHNVKTVAKKTQSVSLNTPKAPKEPTQKWKVKIDGVDFILKKSKQGIASKAMKAKGFNSYSAFLDDLMKQNKVETFEALIDKLKAEKI